MNVIAAMSTKGKALLAGCALTFLVVAVLLVRMASAPSFTEIASGMDPKRTGEVTAALDEAAIAYEVRGNGTTIAVEKGQAGQARIALATHGVDTTAGGMGAKPGYEILDKQKLGTSNLQQQVALQRAMEGELGKMIGRIEGVGSASVALTLPKDELFAEEGADATAAVLLGAGGTSSLDPGAVRGIASLVASSVEGLKPDKVTITDATGTLLWPQGDGAGAGSASKPAAEARFAQQKEAAINAMLAQTLGVGKAQVKVSADLNVDQATEEKLTYARRGVPSRTTEETERLESEGGGAGAAAGTGTNIPSYANAAGGAGGESNYRKTTRSQEVALDKTVTRRTIAPGAINRLGVSVLVDKGAKADLPAIEAAVTTAAGIDAARGDTVQVREIAFAKVEEPKAAAGPVPAGVAGLLKPVGFGLAALLFLFFMTRGLRKRQAGAFAEEPSWLRQLEAPRIAAAINGTPGDRGGGSLDPFDAAAAAREVFKNDPRAMALEDLVQREPEKVAHQLRTWITDDKE